MKKYNISVPIDINDLSKEEKEEAVKEFAEGLIGLETCLRTMWETGLNTSACCAGTHNPYESAYIMMERKVDLFSYLSEETLKEEMLKLECFGKIEIIRVAGNIDKKNEILLKVANDLLSGKKDNKELVTEKLKQDFPLWWTSEKHAYKKEIARREWQEKRALVLKPVIQNIERAE